MPTVPMDNIPRVGPEQLPGARLSPAAPLEAFGGGAPAAEAYGQARALAGDAAHFAAVRHQEQKADMTAVFGAVSQLTDFMTDLQYNKETGIVSKQGENAFPLAKSVPEDFKKKASEIEATLTTPEQKQAFRQHAMEHWDGLNKFNQSHIARQSELYEAKQADSLVSSKINAGGLAAANGDRAGMETAISDVESASTAYAHAQGMPPAAFQEYVSGNVSKAYGQAIISSLTAGQDQTAQAIFDENKDKITAHDKDRLVPHLLEGSTTGAAQRITDGLFARAVDFTQGRETGPVYGTEKDLQDAVDAATKDANPLVKAKVESMAIRRYNIEKTAQKETQDATFQGLADQLRKTGDLESIQQLPGYATLDENDKRQLEVTASRIAKEGSPYAKVSDPRVVTKFDSMSREDLASLSEADLLRRAPSVTEAQYEKMSTAWKAARNKEDLAEFKITEQDNKAIFMAIRNSPAIQGMDKVRSEGDLLKPSNKDTNAAFVDFKKEIRDKLEAEASKKTLKRLTQKERDEVINDAVIERSIPKPRGLLEKYAPYLGAVSAAPVLGALVGYGYSKYRDSGSPAAKVTDQERTDIRDAVIRITGVEPSEEKIAQMKMAMQRGASRGLLERLAGE